MYSSSTLVKTQSEYFRMLMEYGEKYDTMSMMVKLVVNNVANMQACTY